MKKLLILIIIAVTLNSCTNTGISETTNETNFIPQRFIGNWRSTQINPVVKATIKANSIEVGTIKRINGVVTKDETMLFKADLANGEKLILQIAGSSPNEVLGITITSPNSSNNYVTNGVYVRE
jgi:hypothetical protein